MRFFLALIVKKYIKLKYKIKNVIINKFPSSNVKEVANNPGLNKPNSNENEDAK